MHNLHVSVTAITIIVACARSGRMRVSGEKETGWRERSDRMSLANELCFYTCSNKFTDSKELDLLAFVFPKSWCQRDGMGARGRVGRTPVAADATSNPDDL